MIGRLMAGRIGLSNNGAVVEDTHQFLNGGDTYRVVETFVRIFGHEDLLESWTLALSV